MKGINQLVLRLRPWLLVAVMLLLASCGGSDNCLPANISSLSPSTGTAGGPEFTLTVGGSNFVSTSVVLWNGSQRATTVVSATQLTAIISASDIANIGAAKVQVRNFGTISLFAICTGGDSSSLTFNITP